MFNGLKKLFGYEGKNVVVTGVASGMARGAAELLIELGANVYAVDINPINLLVLKAFQVDFKKRKKLIE